ncbi:MAG: urease accessory UreF family protein [Cyanobacteria bacterium J06648_1]
MTNQPSNIKQKLTLIQLADSFFPSGSYTLSHGLESLIQQGKIQQPEDITDFLKILLRYKTATCDLVALVQAHQASVNSNVVRITAIAAQLQALTPIETIRKTQLQSGRALLMVAQSTWKHPLLEVLEQQRAVNQFDCLHPVVFGVVGSIADLNQTDTALAFLHGFVTGVLGAAIRLGSLGHLQAQQILLDLSAEMETAYQTASTMNLAAMWSCTPTIDLAQMRHSRLNSRLFAS